MKILDNVGLTASASIFLRSPVDGMRFGDNVTLKAAHSLDITGDVNVSGKFQCLTIVQTFSRRQQLSFTVHSRTG
jgi:hypothetical protein